MELFGELEPRNSKPLNCRYDAYIGINANGQAVLGAVVDATGQSVIAPHALALSNGAYLNAINVSVATDLTIINTGVNGGTELDAVTVAVGGNLSLTGSNFSVAELGWVGGLPTIDNVGGDLTVSAYDGGNAYLDTSSIAAIGHSLSVSVDTAGEVEIFANTDLTMAILAAISRSLLRRAIRPTTVLALPLSRQIAAR